MMMRMTEMMIRMTEMMTVTIMRTTAKKIFVMGAITSCRKGGQV